jgi:hypothetical protein
MKKNLIGALMLVVVAAALAGGTTTASAAAGFTISLSITPSAALSGGAVSFSGDYANGGVGVAGATITWTRWANGDCSGPPDGTGTLATTDGSGHYTFSSTNGLPSGPWSFETSAAGATSPCREFISGAVAPTPTMQVDHTFLCYSKWQTQPGVWDNKTAAKLLAAGYWLPTAVDGNVAGGTNVGKYNLQCNVTPKGDGWVGATGVFYTGDWSAYAAANGGLYPH